MTSKGELRSGALVLPKSTDTEVCRAEALRSCADTEDAVPQEAEAKALCHWGVLVRKKEICILTVDGLNRV